MIQAWVSPYVGLPFVDHGRGPGYDCWGLVLLVLRERYGVEAPDFGGSYSSTRDIDGVPAAFAAGEALPEWSRVDAPAEGDVVVILVAGKPMHCGVVVGANTMLHARPKTGSVVERYDRPHWGRRVEGFYRHRSRA